MGGYINLKTLTLDELVGVVNLYPWFGNARKELCMRLSAMGDRDTAAAALSDAALYVSSRKALSGMEREKERQDCSDKDIERLLKAYIAGEQERENAAGEQERRVFVVGGDYFSQEQYERVRSSDDVVFRNPAKGAGAENVSSGHWEDEDAPEFYTETLARIYAEQGYPEQAKRIYSKLSLAYPEKNAYFAALIRKLEQEN